MSVEAITTSKSDTLFATRYIFGTHLAMLRVSQGRLSLRQGQNEGATASSSFLLVMLFNLQKCGSKNGEATTEFEREP